MRNIENDLHGNGNIIGAAQRAGKSLSGPGRRIILRRRDAALRAGYCDSTINALEWEGVCGMKGSRAFPVGARFIGIQETGVQQIKLRLYNIEGDHELNASTVGVSTLLRNGIMPRDMKLPQIIFEFLKEQFAMFFFWLRGLVRR